MTDDIWWRYKPMPETEYPVFAEHLREGRIPDDALTALRELDPGFTAYIDSLDPTPAAPAIALSPPESEEAAA